MTSLLFVTILHLDVGLNDQEVQMKKWLLCLLAVGLLMTGCQGTASINSDEIKSKTEAVFQSMKANDFAAVVKQMDDKLAVQVNDVTLKAGWDQTVSQLGEFRELADTAVEEKEGVYSSILKAHYTNQGMLLSTVWNKKGKLIGINIAFTATPQQVEESDTWKESSVEVGELKLAGKLTLPKEGEKFPVVILIQGSGQSDMDETVGTANNKPFADLAHSLADKGIATLRYDKRYFTYPEKADATITIEKEVTDDAKAAIQLASTLDKIDPDQIFVLGHSLGGMLMPKIIAENSQIKGGISLAGTLRSLQTVMVEQLIAQLEETPNVTDAQKTQAEAQYTAEAEKVLALTADTKPTVIFGQPSGYWYSLTQAAGENFLPQITQPMLIMQGGKDIQVYPDKDYPLWQEKLADRDNVQFQLYPELNHLFMKSITGKAEDYNTAAHVDQQVIDDIVTWITTLK